MRLLAALLFLPTLAIAAPPPEPLLRPSAELIFKHPALLQPGRCVRYEEGGNGWVITEPLYYLKGKVVAAEVRTRHIGLCPVIAGKNQKQYSREEYNRYAHAYPCVKDASEERDTQIGLVRIKINDWETPYERKSQNSGRLWRGMFIERQLEKNMEIELEADLLGVCEE